MIQQVSPAESDATSAENSRATITYAFGRCDYCGQGQRVVCRRLSGGASPLLIGCAPIVDLGECNSVSLLNGLDLRDRLREMAVNEHHLLKGAPVRERILSEVRERVALARSRRR